MGSMTPELTAVRLPGIDRRGNEMGNITFDFTGRSVIVTGGARGIGLELGRALMTWRADMFLVDLDENEVVSAAPSIGATPVVGDVTSTADVDPAVALAVEQTGRVDVLVNNAGILRDALVWKLGDNDWDAVMGTHLGGAFASLGPRSLTSARRAGDASST
jgi:3-oxoacyl-[acyl-carrier protein] reductase